MIQTFFYEMLIIRLAYQISHEKSLMSQKGTKVCNFIQKYLNLNYFSLLLFIIDFLHNLTQWHC